MYNDQPPIGCKAMSRGHTKGELTKVLSFVVANLSLLLLLSFFSSFVWKQFWHILMQFPSS